MAAGGPADALGAEAAGAAAFRNEIMERRREMYRVNSVFDTLPAIVVLKFDVREMRYAYGDVDIQSACGHIQSAIDRDYQTRRPTPMKESRA
jgi:hypothetical protein